jgi:hypothetical protein
MRQSNTAWLLSLAAGCAALGLATAASAAQTTADDAAPIATSNGSAAPTDKVDPHAAPALITWPALPGDDDADAPPPPRKIHGMVEAGVGTGGYREVGGVVTIPLGKDGQSGEVTVAVQQVNGGRSRWR